jgi:hypothetical protein
MNTKEEEFNFYKEIEQFVARHPRKASRLLLFLSICNAATIALALGLMLVIGLILG